MVRMAESTRNAELIDVALPTRRYDAVDDLWIVTAYFNPAGYRSRRVNHELFRARVVESGLRLVTVECALGDAPFELPAAPDVLHVRARSVLWHKERLLNLGVARLPSACTKVAWLDGDVVFDNPAWAVETSRLLDRHAVVQPFARPLRLMEGCRTARRGDKRGIVATMRCDRPALDSGDAARHGETGLAWAAQRRVIAATGLYDGSVVGGGDHVMAHAWCGGWSSPCLDLLLGRDTAYRRHAQQWASRLPRDVCGDVAHVEGTLFHLWHGDKDNRFYKARHRTLQGFAYDPAADLRLGQEGCWEWASAKPELHGWVAGYFAQRQEDGAAAGHGEA